MRFIELERIIKKDGWLRKSSNGSHIHYRHPTKKGKVTIPNHPGDLDPKTVNSVLKLAGIK